MKADRLTPPLKWAGGKRWLLPRLEAVWQKSKARRLVEPLCGGLAVSLGLRPRQALLNDSNEHLINFYRWLQRGLQISLAMRNEKDLYYAYRDLFNELISRQDGRRSQRAAELFYYLNRTGYNGLCRFNRQGRFNVPFGRHRKINYRIDFREYQQVLAAWEFRSGDFFDLPLREDDFVYADPPYDVEFRQYSTNGFAWSDQVRLAEWLARHPGPVIISNQATGRVVELYASLGFEIEYLAGPRRISCKGNRQPALEVLASKNL